MSAVHSAFRAARWDSGRASHFRWSKVSPPRQPVRSLPLNSATNPGGGWVAASTRAGEVKQTQTTHAAARRATRADPCCEDVFINGLPVVLTVFQGEVNE